MKKKIYKTYISNILKKPKQIIISKKAKKIITCFCIFTLILITYSQIYGAAGDPTLVNKLNTALKRIQGYLVKLATPAAGVTIATGVLVRKLSFGDEEKMVKGKKIITNAIIGYGIIISIDLIIKFVTAVLK
jgi:hypothetical protein